MNSEQEKEHFERLKYIIEQTGLPFFADAEKQVILIPVPSKMADSDSIYITLQGSEKNIIVATFTVLNGDKKYKYPSEVFKECMKFNKHEGLIKAEYDERYGDIDITYESWIGTLPEHLSVGIKLLFAGGEKLAKLIKPLVEKKQNEVQADTK